MSEPMTLFGGPLDNHVIDYKGGWKVTILSRVNFRNLWPECFFDDYTRLGPDLRVLAWSGPPKDPDE
jgi:hypothetical protein